MAGRFARVETRRRARKFLFGLLADLPRKNCWTIAEYAGDGDPHGMQLAVIAAGERADQPAPAGLIALTCNEIRRLFTVFVIEPDRTLACPTAWSHWRRRHQHRARTSHYRRHEIAHVRS